MLIFFHGSITWPWTRLKNLTCGDNDPIGDVSWQVWPMHRPEGSFRMPCEVTFEGEFYFIDDQWQALCLIELDNSLVPPKYLIKNNCSFDVVVPLLSYPLLIRKQSSQYISNIYLKYREETEGQRELRRRTKCGLVMRDKQCLDTDLKLVYASLSPIIHIANIASSTTESVANVIEIHDGLDLSVGNDNDYGHQACNIFSVKFLIDGRELIAASSDASIYV
ncbi:hypothetical protein POM88_053047 [Heracleum sosnowskyi]|uniref:Uncharacterized protein n=1 Tax=Heracleum sosnowskyi TaxID=360622 RepID=A0AAD8GR80_9APIA|nr:hypothetical protein POM88_053047 [Heracleum sosnowskyi]